MYAFTAIYDSPAAVAARARARFAAAPGWSWMAPVPNHDKPYRARPLVISP